MPGLPNYRRILGPKNLVEEREIADEYGRSPATFAVIAGDGAFGDITDSEQESFIVEFTPAVGTTGIDAAEQITACFVIYEGDDDAFVMTAIATADVDVSLEGGEGGLLMIPVGSLGLSPPLPAGRTFEVLAIPADVDVEKTGTLSFYTRLTSFNPPTPDPDALVLTVPLSKTYREG